MAVSMSLVMRRTGGSLAARESDVTVTATVTTTGASYNNNQCSGRIRIWGIGGMGGTPILDQTFTHSIPANSTTVIVTKNVTVSQPNGVRGFAYAEVTFSTGISAGTIKKTAAVELPSLETGYNGIQITDAANDGFNFLDDTYHVMVTKSSDVSWYKVYVLGFGTMPRGGRVIAEKASGNPGTFEWTPTTEQYAPYLTDDVEADCEILADFYNAAGSVVTSRQATVRLKVPVSVVPTITSPAIVDSSGAFGRFGAYVSSKSGIRATASTAGVYGSTVTRAELTLGNASYVATSGLSSLSIDAGTLSYAEGVAASLSVKDSRGRTATHSFGTLPVVGYSTPTVAGTTARRVNPSTGAESDTSTTVRVSLTAHTDDINGNGLNAGTLRIYHRQRGAEDWTTDKTLTAENGKFSQDVDVTGISDAYAWEFRVELTDWFGVTSTADYSINTATPLVDFRNNGKGVALLGIANKDGIILNDDTDVNGVLNTYGQVYTRSLLNVLAHLVVSGKNIYMNSGASIIFKDKDNVDTVFFRRSTVESKTGVLDSNTIVNAELQVNGSIHVEGSTITNAVYMRNATYIMGYLSGNANATKLLGMNTSNQVELNWTSGGLKGRVMKQIWSGTWNIGSISIPELHYYNLIVFTTMSNNQHHGIGMRIPGSNYWSLFNMNARTDNGLVFNSIIATQSGSTLTVNKNAHAIWQTSFSTVANGTDGTIYKIYGVV